jgi:hypothetical protein
MKRMMIVEMMMRTKNVELMMRMKKHEIVKANDYDAAWKLLEECYENKKCKLRNILKKCCQ